jgi:transposase InsO family protein
MTEEQKQQVAVFRFGIIHDFVGATRLDHGERERLLREKCARKWEIPCSNQTRLSRSTILRWVTIYLQEGRKLEALYPQERNDKGRSRVLDQETGAALAQLRRQLPDLTVVDLVKQMHERRLVTDGIALSLSSAYRFLHRHDLMAKQPVAVDRRKFEAELPNDLWQSDVMHGPTLLAGDKRRKAYLIAFIDDHSRLITHARFYISEGVVCFMTAFADAVLRRGLPRKLYVDNGSAFRSRQLEYTAAALGIALVHARPYQPQGKGKIERFFKNVRTRFLPCFKGDTLEEINEALDRWLDKEYHQKIHGSTGETPFRRFTSRMECLRAAPDNLSDYFRKTVRRRVNKDRSVVVDRRLFEAPVELIGKRVELLYLEESPEQVEIRYAEKSYGLLRQVDLHVNSRVKRDKNGEIEVSGDGVCESGRLWEV